MHAAAVLSVSRGSDPQARPAAPRGRREVSALLRVRGALLPTARRRPPRSAPPRTQRRAAVAGRAERARPSAPRGCPPCRRPTALVRRGRAGSTSTAPASPDGLGPASSTHDGAARRRLSAKDTRPCSCRWPTRVPSDPARGVRARPGSRASGGRRAVRPRLYANHARAFRRSDRSRPSRRSRSRPRGSSRGAAGARPRRSRARARRGSAW